MTANIWPIGIWPKIFGVVINIKEGAGCRLNSKSKYRRHNGKGGKEAATVSNNAVRIDEPTISAFLFR